MDETVFTLKYRNNSRRLDLPTVTLVGLFFGLGQKVQLTVNNLIKWGRK